MNYCSIEDAWGTNNFTNNFTNDHFKDCKINDNCVNQNNMNTDIKPNIEQFYDIKTEKNEGVVREKIYDFDNTNNELNNCESFILHVRNCRKCYNIIKNQHKPQIIEKIIDENRDTIVLILIGIFILLFFNLINNITKN
jgi:hypothetical protein